MAEPPTCRVCFEAEGPLVSPCACKGTAAYVHAACVEACVVASGSEACKVCRHPYAVAWNYDIELMRAHARNAVLTFVFACVVVCGLVFTQCGVCSALHAVWWDPTDFLSLRKTRVVMAVEGVAMISASYVLSACAIHAIRYMASRTLATASANVKRYVDRADAAAQSSASHKFYTLFDVARKNVANTRNIVRFIPLVHLFGVFFMFVYTNAFLLVEEHRIYYVMQNDVKVVKIKTTSTLLVWTILSIVLGTTHHHLNSFVR